MKLDVIGFGALNLDRLYGVTRIAGAGEESYITRNTEEKRATDRLFVSLMRPGSMCLGN